MTPKQFLIDIHGLSPISRETVEDERRAFLRYTKKTLMQDYVLYLWASALIAIAGVFYGMDLLQKFGLFFGFIVAVNAIFHYHHATIRFGEATQSVNVDDLPQKLLAFRQSQPRVDREITNLLRRQGGSVYRFQITALYDIDRQANISSLKTAIL